MNAIKAMTAAVGVVLAIMLLAGCGNAGTTSGVNSAPVGSPYTVATSAYPVFEAAAVVAGKRAKVTNVLAAGAFTQKLTPAAANKLRKASLAIILGKGTQPEVEQVAAQRTGPTIRLLDVPDSPVGPNSPDLEPNSPVQGQLGIINPYVWLSPQGMAAMLDQVRAAVTAFDPTSARMYEKSAVSYQKTLAALDKNFSRTLSTCRLRTLVTAEPNFAVLAQRYGLTQVPVSGLTDTALPDEQQGQVIAAAARAGATTVFFSRLPPLSVADALQQRYGVRAAVLDSLVDRTDQARRGGADYNVIMGLNLDALQAALGCTKAPSGK